MFSAFIDNNINLGPNTESCSICNIPYREKKDLVKHMRIHADGKVNI